ncbi:DUF1579 domain-containing protein [Undibacterium flavidum]|nr:DUF1579 domain-containing protein [Undibacterium flavidum]
MKIESIAMACLMSFVVASNSFAQGRPDSAKLIAAQQQAMQKLSFMDGEWRGTASTVLPNGEKHQITQTERVGPFLEGGVKVIEGRGYDADGKTVFNAFGTISFSQSTNSYTMHSYAQGFVGDYVLTPTSDGFIWEIPAGPMTIRYTAVIKDGTWKEVGDRITPNQAPIRFFEMELKRLGDTNWPAANAVSPR